MAESCCTVEQMALIGINAQEIAYAYAWGFGAVVTAWFFGFCIGVAVDAIRKV